MLGGSSDSLLLPGVGLERENPIPCPNPGRDSENIHHSYPGVDC